MEPVINIQEKIGKTVGRRKAPRDAFQYAMGLQQTVVDLHRTLKKGICAKGVFRFKTHEEADAWMMQMMSRPSDSRS